jgi:hypothetical protein
MAEIIRPTIRRKKSSVVVKEIKPNPAPNLPRMSAPQFKAEAIQILEERLLYLGVVIPKSKIKRLAPALVQIGKKYYELAEPHIEF